MRKRLMGEASQVRSWLLGAIGLGALAGLLLVVQAWLLSQSITRVFLDSQTLADVSSLLAMLAGIIALRAALLWASDVAAAQVAGAIKHDLRTRLMDHIVALGPSYSAGERTGELTSTLVEGVEALDAYFRQYIPRMALAGLVPLGILIIVFPVDLVSGIVLLVTAPLVPIFMILIGKMAGAVSREQFQALSRLSAHFLDVIQGLPTLKLFGRSRAQIEVIDRVSERYRSTTMGVLRIAFISAL
ncbi:MAG: thiol reductant ABC exporter subunit CydD, partial [Chloroflexi bacterium]|nr:thiol reductant ABC exporter subunit CydD [Chloroflexota bacterium]